MMRLSMLICSSALLTFNSSSATTVLYDFEGQSLSPNIIGAPGISASDAVIQEANPTNATPDEGFIFVVDTGTTNLVSGDHYFISARRLDGAFGVLPVPTPIDAGFSFTLTPPAGTALDFTAALYSVWFGGFRSTGVNYNLQHGLFYQVNAGSIQSFSTAETSRVPGGAGFDVQLVGEATPFRTDMNFELTRTSVLPMTEIGVLNPDDSITFFATFTQDRNNGATFGFAANDLQISGLSVIPEPSTPALAASALAATTLMSRRRRSHQKGGKWV